MPETSREVVVLLPDDTQFSVPVQPSLLASDLLNMAASHCKIKEPERVYFGLVTDLDGESYKNWLELDKPVLDPSQELPKGTDPIKIQFAFKYFIDTFMELHDSVTVEMLYLQCRKAIEKREIVCDADTIFELGALVMQVNFGEFKTEEEAFKHLQSLPVIPPSVFQQWSVRQCEQEVVQYYKLCEKLSRGEAIFKYLEIVQTLPMYSYHYFEVKDKAGAQLWLGVGPDGIVQCSHDNKNDPMQHYQWNDLQNIYYKDKKFSVEVFNTKSPRKAFHGQQVMLLAWYGKSSRVVMAIWKMVRDQHIFYRSRRSAKAAEFAGVDLDESKGSMTSTEILRHLNRRHRLGGSVSPSSSQSSLSLESAKSNLAQGASAEAVAAAKKAQQEMYSALLAKREVLAHGLETKLTRYKELLLKEMQITGVPPEGLTAGEIEKMRTTFGINVKFSKFVLDSSTNYEGDEIEELEKQLEVQQVIIEANKTLVEQAKNRQQKKERQKDVKRAEEKLSKVTEDLMLLKAQRSGTNSYYSLESPGSGASSFITTPGSSGRRSMRHPSSAGAVDDSYLAKIIFNDANTATSQFSPLLTTQRSPHRKSSSALHDFSELPRPRSPVPPAHRRVSGTQSLGYPSQTPSWKSDRSLNTSYYSEGDSTAPYLTEYDNSPRSSVASLNTSRLDDQAHLRTDELIHQFSRGRTHDSPPPTTAGYPQYSAVRKSSAGSYEASPLSSAGRTSSPDLLSPASIRNSFRSSRGATPEPHSTPGLHTSSTMPNTRVPRPPSTHSNEATPNWTRPPSQQQRGGSLPPPAAGTRPTREIDIHEALRMDPTDEGTYV